MGVGVGLVAAWYREWRAGHPAGVYWLLLLVAGPVVVWGVSYLMSEAMGGDSGRVYGYDTVEGSLFVVSDEEFPPFVTPRQRRTGANLDTGEGVRAVVLTCAGCNEDQWYIGYVEGYLPWARVVHFRMKEDALGAGAQPVKPSREELQDIANGHQVARVKAIQAWYGRQSDEGRRIVNEAMKKCPDWTSPRQCLPK